MRRSHAKGVDGITCMTQLRCAPAQYNAQNNRGRAWWRPGCEMLSIALSGNAFHSNTHDDNNSRTKPRKCWRHRYRAVRRLAAAPSTEKSGAIRTASICQKYPRNLCGRPQRLASSPPKGAPGISSNRCRPNRSRHPAAHGIGAAIDRRGVSPHGNARLQFGISENRIVRVELIEKKAKFAASRRCARLSPGTAPGPAGRSRC